MNSRKMTEKQIYEKKYLKKGKPTAARKTEGVIANASGKRVCRRRACLPYARCYQSVKLLAQSVLLVLPNRFATSSSFTTGRAAILNKHSKQINRPSLCDVSLCFRADCSKEDNDMVW